MRKKIFILSVLFVFGLLSAQNFEGFESGNFLSYNWEFSGYANWSTTVDDPFQGNYCAKTGAVEANQYSKLSITLEVVTPSELSFWWKTESEIESDLLIFYLDGSEIASISGNTAWQQYSMNVQVGYYTFSWSYEKDSQGTSGADCGWLDSITFPISTTFDYDLSANYIQGPSALYQGFSGVYDVLVKNYGTNPQDEYSVVLYREGGILLDSLYIDETLESEEEVVHHLVWIVPQDEPAAQTYVYAEVVTAQDDDLSNNVTDNFDVTIYEYGLGQIHIGTGNDLTNWYPFKFHMNASLAETIYMSNEINAIGDIYAISYRSNFEESVLNAPVEVFMAETTANNLAGGWIPAGSLTQVFGGDVDFFSGIHDVVFPFDTPYSYNGSNLCIMTHHVYMTDTFSIDNKFYETINTPFFDRTRAVGSPSPLSPNGPPDGFLFSRFPNINLYISLTNLGIVEGHVYDEVGNLIPTATIDVQQSNISTYSNGAGFYQFGNLIEGNYDFTAHKAGYESATANGIVITDQVTTIDFTLTSLPTVQIEGQITGSIEPAVGLVNATVDLLGAEDYNTQTDADGNFVFPEVYGNESYELNVTYTGFQPHVEQIDVQTDDVDLGIIILDEVALPATNVFASQDLTGTELTLEWNAPVSAMRDFESYTIYRFLSINSNDPTQWTLLESTYNDTTYMDNGWNSLNAQMYQYAVIVNYTNGVISEAALSNEIERFDVGTGQNIPEITDALQSIHPNPFNPSTKISYQLAEDSNVEISIFNVRGQKISMILNNEKERGFHHVVWNGKDKTGKEQASGIYFVRLLVNGKITATRKCMLMK
ncbi:MAG: carboxypeptidase regulatory-like domain-containing protein [Candidatus Cloacimonetes bacterium]|nr:carboxypeptidase regulatory-like domain-containing protein [Candidatus Cloacimonadota bacterium]MCF7814176.1 carboxypeptidase regulatory-like domain-containing protein [Candidatus Cloacimonadota bacterium]MCF7868761.1 carboxypeptidase regulatory-like domain-containing protein [Candidatus Cloacimonadota bacterium]MCF7884164.1 carboxypeptidase regulatory-like domain-containing protein [Candidatus Cloacimonadota bacterium]